MILLGQVFDKAEYAVILRCQSDTAASNPFLPKGGIVRALYPCGFFAVAIMACFNVQDSTAEQFGNLGCIIMCGGAYAECCCGRFQTA